MWIRLQGELRESLVPALLWVGVTLAITLVFESETVALLGLGGLAFHLAVLPWGIEFDRGTLGGLLAQPLARSRLWWEKSLASAITLMLSAGFLLGVLAGVGYEGELATFWWPLLLVACASGALWAFVLRDSLRALWVAMIVPAALYGVTVLTLKLFPEEVGEIFRPEWVLILYGLVAVWWSLRLVRTFELTGSGGRLASGGSAAASRWGVIGRAHLEIDRQRLHPWKELLLKELRLQASALSLVGLMLAGWLLVWLLSPVVSPREAGHSDPRDLGVLIHTGFALISTFVVPLLIGANAVASERRIEVLGWHLVLPVPLRLQWRVKLLGTALLTASLGVVSGLGVMKLEALGWLALPIDPLPSGAWLFVLALLSSVISGVLGLYGSRHAENPISAAGHGLVIGFVAYYLFKLVGFTYFLAETFWLGRRWASPMFSSAILLIFALGLLSWMLWRPSQEEWLGGRRLSSSAILVVLPVLLFGIQILTLSAASLQLDREIVRNNRELERSLQRDTSEVLGLTETFETYAARLVPLVVRGQNLAGLGEKPSGGFSLVDGMVVGPIGPDRWKLTSVTSAMRIVARHDGVDLSDGTYSRWYWEKEFFFALRNYEEGISLRPGHEWRWRGFPSSRYQSVAPLFRREERLEKLDVRVRQVLVERALAVLETLESSPETDWDDVEPLLEQSPLSELVLQPKSAPETSSAGPT